MLTRLNPTRRAEPQPAAPTTTEPAGLQANRQDTASMIAQIRRGHATAEAFKRRTAPPSYRVHRYRIYVIAAAVLLAAVLLVQNVTGTVGDLRHDAPASPPITSVVPAPAPGEYIPTPAGPPTDR